MPPKKKFTRDEVVTAAINLVRRDGIAALTARGLGTELGVSSRPIFTAFHNMDEVKRETILAARALYNEYMEIAFRQEYAFRSVGLQYFRFANNEPKLFELLFMSTDNDALKLSDILPVIDDNSDRILASLQKAFGLTKEIAHNFYQTLWIFTHGLCCLCVTGMSQITEAEALELMTGVHFGMLTKLKGELKEND